MLALAVLAYSAAVSADKGSEDAAKALWIALEARGFVRSDTPDVRIELRVAEAIGSYYISVEYTLRGGGTASSQYAVSKDKTEALRDVLGDIAAVALAIAEWGKPVGSITIITDPPGASIYIGSTLHGKSPLTIRGFELGKEYPLKAYKTGHIAHEGRISAAGVATDTMRIKLSPVELPPVAYREKTDPCAELFMYETPVGEGDFVSNCLIALSVIGGLLLIFGCLL
ncbi:MAG: PEGA domain-containing protein [candidate division WOR-3 bacterium]